jgi:hypothetical protein
MKLTLALFFVSAVLQVTAKPAAARHAFLLESNDEAKILELLALHDEGDQADGGWLPFPHTVLDRIDLPKGEFSFEVSGFVIRGQSQFDWCVITPPLSTCGNSQKWWCVLLSSREAL